MKKFNKLTVALLSIVMFFISTPSIFVSAATNPYPSSQTFNGVSTIPCTYYAWQQAYNNTGIAMPNFGNAKNWYSSAERNGYSVGTTAKANSIAVWTSSGYGHVAYVVSVNGSQMTINEGGMYNVDGSACNGNGIINGSVCPNTVGSKKSSYSSNVLLGFIYLTNTSTSVTLSAKSDKNEISNNNAILWGQVNKPSSYAVTKIGIKVRKDGSTYDKGWSKYEVPSKNYVGETAMYPYYNMNSELNVTLTHATKYYYTFYAMVNGKEYWSNEYSITTTGSHSYPSSWTTVTAATCTASGSAKRSCACGKTETKTISALGHNYSSSWTTDTAATCTTSGTKSKHCTRCSAKTSTTTIAATGHSWSEWKTTKQPTCATVGNQERTCSTCKKTEKRDLAAKGHSYSSQWTIDKEASCTVSGTKSKHCLNCTGKTSITTIPANGHNWSDFEVTVKPTIESVGASIRRCLNNSCTASESKVVAKLAADGHSHSFGELITTKTATCTEEGQGEKKCTQCSEVETYSIAPTGHSFGEWSEENEGFVARKCSLCDTTEQQIVEPVSSQTSSTNPADSDNNETTTLTTETSSQEKDNYHFWIIPTSILFGLCCLAAIILIILKRKKKAE